MFQAKVNSLQAPGVVGDFASTNPFASILAGPGQLTAPAGGLIVGNFAWVGPAGEVSQSYVSGYQVGFLGRNEQALITEFLGEATLVVPEGFMVTLFNVGDFWAKFGGGAAPGDYVFADPNTGAPVAATTDSAPTLGTATAQSGATISSGSASVAAGTTVTITTITHGNIFVGDVISDGVAANIPAGTTIVQQLTGPAGGAGTYQMSAAATGTDSAAAMTVTSGYMLVTAIADAFLGVGDVFSGTDVVAGSAITGQLLPFAGVATVGTLPSTPSTSLVVTAVSPGRDLLRVGAKLVGAGIAAGTTISSQTSGDPGGAGVYVMSANSTAEASGVAITTADSAGGTGVYAISPAGQAFGAASVAETITVAGTAIDTGFRVRGTYSPGANELGKISKF